MKVLRHRTTQAQVLDLPGFADCPGPFIVYQVYRYSYTHGTGLIVLTLFDIFVMALIWHEYQVVRRRLRTK